MEKQINFNLIKARLNNNLRILLHQMGTEAVNFSKDNFRSQGWRDTVIEPWKKRKPGAKRDSGRAILVDSGRLKRSIRLLRMNMHSVTIGTDVPYASAHNEGFKGIVSVAQHKRTLSRKEMVGTGVYSISTRRERRKGVRVASGETTVKAYTRRMNLPQRRFMGRSMTLNNRIRMLIRKQVHNAFN